MAESNAPALRQQPESLYSISIEIARLRELPPVLDRALGYRLELTVYSFEFIGLLTNSQLAILSENTKSRPTSRRSSASSACEMGSSLR